MKLISVSERLKEFRSTKEYVEWRSFILKRDKKCVLCGSKEKLEVDHIKSLALYPRLGLKKNNGRVLCHICHKKTDTYGVFSRFKDSSSIHPVLAGDLLFKIQSLPQTIEIYGKEIGFSLRYIPEFKKWVAGYKFAKVNLSAKENTIEEVVDSIFDKLRYSQIPR